MAFPRASLSRNVTKTAVRGWAGWNASPKNRWLGRPAPCRPSPQIKTASRPASRKPRRIPVRVPLPTAASFCRYRGHGNDGRSSNGKTPDPPTRTPNPGEGPGKLARHPVCFRGWGGQPLPAFAPLRSNLLRVGEGRRIDEVRCRALRAGWLRFAPQAPARAESPSRLSPDDWHDPPPPSATLRQPAPRGRPQGQALPSPAGRRSPYVPASRPAPLSDNVLKWIVEKSRGGVPPSTSNIIGSGLRFATLGGGCAAPQGLCPGGEARSPCLPCGLRRRCWRESVPFGRRGLGALYFFTGAVLKNPFGDRPAAKRLRLADSR